MRNRCYKYFKTKEEKKELNMLLDYLDSDMKISNLSNQYGVIYPMEDLDMLNITIISNSHNVYSTPEVKWEKHTYTKLIHFLAEKNVNTIDLVSY